MIIWADVVLIAPEVSTVSMGTQASILDIVRRQVNSTAWGDRENEGMVYLAAHLATLSRRQGAGQVLSEKLGEMARSYAPMVLRGSLGLTAYGAEYDRLIETLTTRIGIVA